MKDNNIGDIPEEILANYSKDVLSSLQEGKSVTCLFSAGGGKRSIFKYLSSVSKATNKKTLFVYIDPDDMFNMSSEAYLQLILDSFLLKMREKKISTFIDSTITNPLLIIRKNLKNIILKGWKVVFILCDFEITLSFQANIYLNLESILDVDKSKISYLFLSSVNLLNEDTLKNFRSLKYAVSQKVNYFALLNKNDAFLTLDFLSKKIEIKINPEIKECLYRLCGGHVQLLKYSLKVLEEEDGTFLKNIKKIEDLLINDHQLKVVCTNIWESFSEDEQSLIITIVNTEGFHEIQKSEVEYLTKLGFIKEIDKDKYKLTGLIYESFVRNIQPRLKLAYDDKTKKMYLGGKSCEDKFSHQEYKLLVHFITHENELITRDQVAEAIWGKFYLEKYSDWSIDKMISILRKKLDNIGFSSMNLVTLKKRGFSFSNF